MFDAFFQLMGFPVAKHVHSPAKELPQELPSKADLDGIKSEVSDPVAKTTYTSASEKHGQDHPARRQQVKAQSANATEASHAVATAVKAKSAKTVVKSAPDSAVEAQPQAPVKKTSSVKVPKSTPTVEASVVETAPIKAVKSAAKVQVKVSVKTIEKASTPEVVVSKPKVSRIVKAGTIAKAMSASTPVAVLDSAAASASAVPARAGRPSSRLAQLTVPSMAQSVASTAAKASFTQAVSAPIISPPLASSIKKDPKLANNWKSKPVDQLTDAELIAMPDDEYMNDTQLAFFRLKLVTLKLDILNSAGETTEHLREETVVVPDPTDRATIEEEHALELRTRDRERKLLKKIEQSIVRIDAGEYGYCDETGEAIGVGRLLARPTANLSLEAQQRRELRQKMFGD
jgi:DnaK suppressor protein